MDMETCSTVATSTLSPSEKEKILSLVGRMQESHDIPRVYNAPLHTSKRKTTPTRPRKEDPQAYARMVHRLDGSAWEFGSLIHFDNPVEVAHYLEHLDDWINYRKWPKDFLVYKQAVRDYVRDKPHRRLALTLLAKQKNWQARRMIRSLRGVLTLREFETIDYVPQSFEVLIYGTIATCFCSIFLYILARASSTLLSEVSAVRAQVQTVLTPAVAQNVATVSNNVAAFTSGVSSVFDSISSAVATVKKWFKDTFDKIYALFSELHPLTRIIIKGIVSGIVLFMSLAYATTIFPDAYKSVKRYLYARLGLVTTYEAQGSGDVLTDILDVIRRLCTKAESSSFFSFLGKLPKLVSIAKAIEWIVDHMHLLVNVIVEACTGKTMPRNKDEQMMDDLRERAAALDVRINVGTAALVNDTVLAELDQLELAIKTFSFALQRSTKTVRPWYSSGWHNTTTLAVTLRKKIDLLMLAARKRPIPVWVYIHGPPGVGKSHILESLMKNVWDYVQHFSKSAIGVQLYDQPWSNAMIFSLPQKETYYDGYCEQPFVLIDDLFQQSDPEVRSSMAATLINMVSPAPYTLLTADPGKKGKVHFTSTAIFSTTNLTTPFRTANLGLVDPSALETRRTLMIYVPQRDTYVLTNPIDGVANTNRTLSELASIIGEAILQAHTRSEVPAPYLCKARFLGSFESDRLSFDTSNAALDHSAIKGEPDYQAQGNGKDKEKETEYSRPSTPGVHRFNSDMLRDPASFFFDTPGALDALLETLTPDTDDGWSDEALHALAVYKSSKPTQRAKTFKQVLSFGGLTSPHVLFERALDLGDTPALFNYRCQLAGESRGVADPQIRHTVTYRTAVSDSDFVSSLFSFDTFFGLVNQNPGYVLFPTLAPGMDISSPAAQRYWLLSHSFVIDDLVVSPPMKGYYHSLYPVIVAQLLQSWSVKEPGWIQKQYKNCQQRLSLLNGVLVSIAGISLVLYALKSVLRLIMPSAAYEAQAYDQKIGPKKKDYGRRARRREHVRQRQAPPVFTAQSDVPYAAIAGNVDLFKTQVFREGTWETYMSAYMTFIGGTTALAPGHCFPEDEDFQVVFGEGQGVSATYHSSKIQIHPSVSDLVTVTFDNVMRARRVMYNHFASDPVSFGVIALMVPTDTGIWTIERGTGWERKVVKLELGEDSFETDLMVHGVANRKGYCGLPYVHLATGKIVAIHMGGSPSTETGLGVIVLKEELPQVNESRVVSLFPEDFSTQACPGVHVIGRMSPHASSHIPRESKLRRTPFDVSDFPFPESTDAPAPLEPVGDANPLHLALLKFSQQSDNPRYLSVHDFSDYLPKTFCRTNIRRLTLEEAIYGIPGLIDAIDMTTSSGYFYKKMHLTRFQLFFSPDGKRRIHPVFLADISYRLKLFSEGRFKPAVFENVLKDELRSEAKIRGVSARLFASGDLGSLVTARMILGMLYAEMTRDPAQTPSALGINPHSSQWGDLYQRLRHDPDAFPVDGDFSAYDISRKNDDDEDFVRMLKSLSDDPYLEVALRSCDEGEHICGRLLFDRPWGTNSGAYDTSWKNTFANWRRHKICFNILYPHEDFSQIAKTYTGDDSVHAVPLRFSEFNMENLVRLFWDNWRMVYTAPDKTTTATRSWDDVVYLKRRFVIQDGMVLAPLAPSSISNIAKWTTGVYDAESFRSSMSSIMLEAWHYGPKKYSECLFWVRKASRTIGFIDGVPDWQAMWHMRSSDYLYLAGVSPGYEIKLPAAGSVEKPASCKTTGIGILCTELAKDFTFQGDETRFFNPRTCRINRIATTQTNAKNSTEVDAPQELTSPTETSLFQTPTMGFGEVGMTGLQITPGYASNAHGVGQFQETRLLERMAIVGEFPWAVTDPLGPLVQIDVDKLLRNYARNAMVLTQFHYYRSNIEVTVRLVTNQFYYGSLMVTLFPTITAGQFIDSRSVLDPTILSATSDESIIKEWDYSWPMAWKSLDLLGNDYPTNLIIDVLCPLKMAKDGMADSITIQIWARFKDIELSYPTQPTLETYEVQGKGGVPKVKFPAKRGSDHPSDDRSAIQRETGNTVDAAFDAISSVTIGDAISEVKSLASFVTDNWGSITSALGFLFDKPDRAVSQDSMNMEALSDAYNTDLCDTNVSLGMYKSRYVDPGVGRMPMSKNMTISEYARIPAIRVAPITFTAQGQAVEIVLLQSHNISTTWKTPADYAWLNSTIWRGSYKVMLMFFTSTFISTRVSVSYINAVEYPSGYPTDYSNGISKIINVKGDTIDRFTVPWLSTQWWEENNSPRILIKIEAPITSSDVTLDPVIYCVVWSAAGDDIQYAFPRIPDATQWVPSTLYPITPTVQTKGKEKTPTFEVQSAPGKEFQKTFPSIIPNTHYDIDRGFCTAENLGPIADIMKRYSYMPDLGSGFVFNGATLDKIDGTGSDLDTAEFRQTFFGMWRQAFLFRSGGYRYRHYDAVNSLSAYYLTDTSGYQSINGTVYRSAFDGMSRLTVPQVAVYPFAYLGQSVQLLSLATATPPTITPTTPRYVAARDDIQLGYPILPQGIYTVSRDVQLDSSISGKNDDFVVLPGRSEKKVSVGSQPRLLPPRMRGC